MGNVSHYCTTYAMQNEVNYGLTAISREFQSSVSMNTDFELWSGEFFKPYKVTIEYFLYLLLASDLLTS